MVTSDFRPEVEIPLFRVCAMKNMQYNPYLWPKELRLPADHEDLSLLSDLTHVSSFLSSPLSHPLLLLSSTPGPKLIFSIDLFLNSFLPFHPPDRLHGLQLFFVFLGLVSFNFGTVARLSWLLVSF